MKIAFVGKGGVGKTSLSAIIAQIYAKSGKKVTAVDADPTMNLAYGLGYTIEEKKAITPLSEMKDLIEERTGAKSGQSGGFFILNPKVDDLADKIGIVKRGIQLIVMGTVKQGGGGCICPESAILKTFFTHLFFNSEDILIVDMEAGIEHLGRATGKTMDAMIVVVEPTCQSVDVTRQIRKLATDIEVKNLLFIGNKVTCKDDEEFIRKSLPGEKIAGFVPFFTEFRNLYQQESAINDLPEEVIRQVSGISQKIEEYVSVPCEQV